MAPNFTPRRAASRGPLPLTAWAGFAWITFVGVLVVVSPDQPCTADSPCAPSWPAAAGFGAIVLGIVAMFASARIALPGALVASGGVVMLSLAALPPPVPWPVSATTVFALVGMTVWLAAVDRETTGRRRLDGPLGLGLRQWPGQQRVPVQAGRTAIAGAALLAALAAAAAGMWQEHREVQWQQYAPQLPYRVTAYDDEEWRVEAERDGRRVEFEVLDENDYPIGSSVLLWDDGTKVRPVAEPYDPLGWQLTATGLAAAALYVGARLLIYHNDVRALLTRPVPATQVAIHDRGNGHWVIVADPEAAHRRSRWRFKAERVGPPPDKRVPATAYGHLAAGELVAVYCDGGTQLLPLAGLVSVPDRRRRLTLDGQGTGIDAAEPVNATPTVETTPAPDGLVFAARGWRLVVGVVELAGALVGFPLLVATDPLTVGSAWDLFELVFVVGSLVAYWAVAFSGFVALFNVIHAGPEGITLVGIFRRSVLPWASLSGAVSSGADVTLLTTDGERVSFVGPVAWINERRQEVRAAEAAHRLTARIELERARTPQPTTEPGVPVRRWRPAGFVLAAVCVATTVAALWSALH